MRGLTGVIWLGLVSALGLGIGATLRLVAGDGGSETPAPVTFRAGSLPGMGQAMEQGAVALCRDGSGYFALSLVCPHLGCRPAWQAGKKLFLCPCHASKFAFDGSRLAGPTPRGLEHLTLQSLPDGSMRAFPGRPCSQGQRLKA